MIDQFTLTEDELAYIIDLVTDDINLFVLAIRDMKSEILPENMNMFLKAANVMLKDRQKINIKLKSILEEAEDEQVR